MKRFLKNIILFSIPFWIYAAFIIIIDPYEFINISHLIPASVKIKAINRNDESGPRGNILWKMIHYRRHPVPSVLLGDSQTRGISRSMMNGLSGKPWYNMSVPGASYETMFDLFDFAVQQGKVKEVVYEVSFMNFNANRSYSLTHFGTEYLEDPVKYFTRKEIFLDSWANFWYTLTGDEQYLQDNFEFAPQEEQDRVAADRLNLFFGNYSWPEFICEGLDTITEECRKNNIRLTFLIMPTYIEVHTYLEKKGLMPEYLRFKEKLKSLAPVIDYDTGLDWSRYRENFTDYFHPRQPLLDRITREVWGDAPMTGTYWPGPQK